MQGRQKYFGILATMAKVTKVSRSSKVLPKIWGIIWQMLTKSWEARSLFNANNWLGDLNGQKVADVICIYRVFAKKCYIVRYFRA